MFEPSPETRSPAYRIPQQQRYPQVYGPPPKRGVEWKKFWLILAGILAGFAALGGVLWWNTYSTAKDTDVEITSCRIAGDTATVALRVTNTGSIARSVRVDVEYRDSSGALLDTDTWNGTVPAGDTVSGQESTILDAPSDGGTCAIAGVG